jgi:hypothetical protein
MPDDDDDDDDPLRDRNMFGFELEDIVRNTEHMKITQCILLD